MRTVILVCGPPGAGKTTLARRTGLTVYDIDDAQWNRDEHRFRRALAAIARDPAAQAVVIRSGATPAARVRAARLIGATETKVITLPARDCKARILARGRDVPPIAHQLAAVDAWWDAYQRDGSTAPAKPRPRRSTATDDPRLKSPERVRLRAAVREDAMRNNTPCGYCRKPIDWRARWPHPRSYVLDEYPVPRRMGGDPLDPSNVRPAHLGCNSADGARATNAGRTDAEPTTLTSRRW